MMHGQRNIKEKSYLT